MIKDSDVKCNIILIKGYVMSTIRYKKWQPFVYLLPALIFLIFVYGYPLVRIFDFSMRRIRGASGPFIGLDNYKFVLRNPVFQQAVENNLFLLIGVPILVISAAVIAALLWKEPRGWKFYRFSLFVPFIIAIPVVGIVFSYMLTKNGVVNVILEKLKLGFIAKDWLGDPGIAMKTLLVIIIWKELGFGIVLCFARLMSVPKDMFEAAKIDGANWWQTFTRLMIPELSFTIEFFAMISIINFLSWVFAYVYVITHGGPGTSTYVMELWIFSKISRGAPNPGMGAAASVLLFLSTLVFVFLVMQLRKRGKEDV